MGNVVERQRAHRDGEGHFLAAAPDLELNPGTRPRLLHRLDRFSLAAKRAVTVPLLKQMLAEEGA